MSEKVWHYSVGDDRHGPVTAEELKRLAAAGEIDPDDLVWKKGMADWVAAGMIKGLFAKQTAPPKPVPPPPPPKGPTAAPAAPLALDDAEADDKPANTKTGGPLRPLVVAWQKMPTGGKIGVAGGGLLLVFLLCGGVAVLSWSLLSGKGGGGGWSLPLGGGGSSSEPLGREFKADRASAEKKHKGKTMTIKGTVSYSYPKQRKAALWTTTDLSKEPNVTLVCFFDDKHDDQLAAAKRGDELTVRGVCQGILNANNYLIEVKFENCEVVVVEKEVPPRPGEEVTIAMVSSQIGEGMSKAEVERRLGVPRRKGPPPFSSRPEELEWFYNSCDEGKKYAINIYFGPNGVYRAQQAKFTEIVLRGK